MAFSEICRICLSVKVRMVVLNKTGLQNLYKTLTNRFLHEDEEPIIVCFICHARLIRCQRLQQQAIESNAVLEQWLAGGSMSIPKPHEARDEFQFTPICHIDIRPVECDIGNDCKDEIFSLDSIKIEEENFENENSIFEENGNRETEQIIITTNIFSKPSEKKIQNSTDCNINGGNLDLERSTIKSNPRVKKDNQTIDKKGKLLAKVMKKKILKKESVNILMKGTSGSSTKNIFECDGCSKKFSTKDILIQENKTQVEQTPVPQRTEIFNCDICQFETSQKRCILAHLKAHGAASQMYTCKNCNYKCANKSNFLHHMKIHTGEKPFSCKICEFQCIQKSQIIRHIKIHTREKHFS